MPRGGAHSGGARPWRHSMRSLPTGSAGASQYGVGDSRLRGSVLASRYGDPSGLVPLPGTVDSAGVIDSSAVVFAQRACSTAGDDRPLSEPMRAGLAEGSRGISAEPDL